MNTYIVALLIGITATIVAARRDYDEYSGYKGDYFHGYPQGLRKVFNGYTAPYNNADRQAVVNYAAEKVGASSGTYHAYGVPGTGRNFGYSAYYGYPSHHRDNYYPIGY